MARSAKTIRRFFVGRSVAVLFGLQATLFIGAHAATNLGFETVANYFDVVIEGAIAGILLVAQLVGWFPTDIGIGGVLLLYLAVYYVVAVIVAAPGRVAYQVGRRQLTR